MITLAVVLCCLALFVILCFQLEDQIHRGLKYLLGKQVNADERISKLEANEFEAEKRISTLEFQDYAAKARLDRQAVDIDLLKGEVKELGEDVGWEEDKRKTQVMKRGEPDDAA